MRRISKLTAGILSIILLVALDQVTKGIAQANLMGKGTIPIFGDFFVLVYATNRGGFLSFGSGAGDWLWWLFFVALPVAVLIMLTIYVVREKKEDWFYLSFWVFVVSGGVGNLIDRVLYGEVIDFMNIGFGSVRTGIFNVADLYLNVFAILVVIIYLARGKKEEKSAPSEPQE